jgi:membrane-associated phospholipid phosphatase
MITLTAMLTMVQIVSRLALGRHLIMDLVAGMALGLLLTVCAVSLWSLAGRFGERFETQVARAPRH